MKSGFTTLAKILSICCSLALLSGYVWWRYDTAKKDEQARLDALNKAREKAIAAQRANMEELEVIEIPPDVLMSSPKSMKVMPSSKSGPVAIDLEELLEQNPELRKQLEERAKEAKEQNAEGEVNPLRERMLMPSTKSGFVPPRQQSEGK